MQPRRTTKGLETSTESVPVTSDLEECEWEPTWWWENLKARDGQLPRDPLLWGVLLHTRSSSLPLTDGPLDLIQLSGLSVRIEELDAQISALHVENLRLRTRRSHLARKFKKKKERSQRIVTDAESAVRCHRLCSSLTKCPTFYILLQFRLHSIIGCPF